MNPDTNHLALLLRTPSLHLAFCFSCPNLLLSPKCKAPQTRSREQRLVHRQAGGAGVPAASPRHLSILPIWSLLSVPVPGGTENFTVGFILTRRLPASRGWCLHVPLDHPSSRNQTPPASYNLPAPADAPHPHWHLTTHSICKVTNQCKINLRFPLPPSGREKKQQLQPSVGV